MQAMVWLGLPEPPFWHLVLYMLCIGMFGVGVGMLYTPLLVDRMRLPYPSGFAVANILRALTDRTLLKRSIAKLGGGMLVGYVGGLFSLNVGWFVRHGLSDAAVAWLGRAGISASTIVALLEKAGISTSTFGAGMIVGARIAIPAFVVGVTGYWLTPYLRSIHWLDPDASYRKIGFIISLGTILGAAILDITLILIQAARRFRQPDAETAQPAEDWKRVNILRLVIWVLFWSAATVLLGHQLMGTPVFLLTVAVGLCFVFVLVNGIAQGISDWNPLSSAFVMTVLIFVALGLHDPAVGLLAAAVVFIACSAGGDMQQDRSTGWRLGTNRVVQFRYQVIGILMGAALAVALAKLFMNAYPVLRADQFINPHEPGAQKWQSAMTFKMVGALRGITHPKPYVMTALQIGLGLGLFIEIARKLFKRSSGFQRFAQSSRSGRITDFLVDAVFLPSPYASAFGGFVEIPAVLWWTAGGVGASLFDAFQAQRAARRPKPVGGELPADMSTMSLVGGGLIAGDSLAALSVGIYMLLGRMIGGG